jgi:pimeloyl-ACP methyl ester carboxylesterase
MTPKKTNVKNRKGQNMVVLLELCENQKGLAFVMHGLGGFKEQKHIETFAAAFKKEGFSVIRFDTTNTLGESDGKYEHARTTDYYEDLEDVIEWSKSQEWYEEPFWLCGHSLGGLSTALFAEKHPSLVKALAPISTVVSGKLCMEKPKYGETDEIKNWRETGWEIKESSSKPGVIKRLPWSHMEDRLKYDLLDNVEKLTMPVLLIVGDEDDSTPTEHQQILYNKLKGDKEIHIIKGAPHTFKEQRHLLEIKDIMRKWIKRVK